MHALKSGMSVRAYAEKVGRAYGTVNDELMAARVMTSCLHVQADLAHSVLAAIHAAPAWLWPALMCGGRCGGFCVHLAVSLIFPRL